MNLNDRVALILGRAIIRAEELQVRLEQQEQELAALKAEHRQSSKVKRRKPPLTKSSP